jgi:hypothetical protein
MGCGERVSMIGFGSRHETDSAPDQKPKKLCKKRLSEAVTYRLKHNLSTRILDVLEIVDTR